jgi:hypothetical protein
VALMALIAHDFNLPGRHRFWLLPGLPVTDR